MGIVGAVWAVASALGPVLGGIFAEKLNWRWCFYVNCEFAALPPLCFVVPYFLCPPVVVATALHSTTRAVVTQTSHLILSSVIQYIHAKLCT